MNIIAGVGSAAESNIEEIGTLLSESPRGRQIMPGWCARACTGQHQDGCGRARELFNSAYWASRPYRGTEQHRAPPARPWPNIPQGRSQWRVSPASRLRVDALKLHRLFNLVPDDDPHPERESVRRAIGVLQAVRLALLQHMFLQAISVPAFSRANDISRTDVLEMVFTLRIDDALANCAAPFRPAFRARTISRSTSRAKFVRAARARAMPRSGAITSIRSNRPTNCACEFRLAIANEFGAHG